MSDPLQTDASRLDDLLASAIAGEPINWKREALIQAIDIASAGVHFTREAVSRTRLADEAADRRMIAADNDMAKRLGVVDE